MKKGGQNLSGHTEPPERTLFAYTRAVFPIILSP